MLERSLRELRQLQSLQSERVAPVVACGKLPDGGLYEVNPPLPSQRLDELITHGPLAAPEAAALIDQVGQALLEAQKVGVTHRNLGPRVVHAGAQGVMVTGFAVGEPHDERSFGPLDTIAPEQVEGKVVDQRTLIYNLAALMHMLLHGAPLFGGDPAEQLRAHLHDEPPAEVHARLRRALGKDPRMRPMMLKQFLSELRAIGGGVARAPVAPSAGGPTAPPVPGEPVSGSAPSSRGWTMFMKEDGSPADASPAKAPPVAGGTAAAPKTRGWTMFTAAADVTEAESKPADAPKPSTRGWTMFMQEESGGAASPGEAAAEAGPPEAGPGGAKPKTRGWTMFMEAEGEAPAQAETPVQAEAPPASSAELEPPSVGGGAPKPKTRGWTMFMQSDESEEAKAAQSAAPAVAPSAAKAPAVAPSVAPPVAPPAAPAFAPPTAPSVGSSAASTPAKSRGWTVFMQGAADAKADADAAAEAPVEEPMEADAAEEAGAFEAAEAAVPEEVALTSSK
ncbi:MAG: hypothetical protein KDK70_41530, partial [Myxococcales bacterium]|nr:hypothetical protein [Myxococcales bacterium]